jgi:hypothetical protein
MTEVSDASRCWYVELDAVLFGGNSLMAVCSWLCVLRRVSVSERLWQPGFDFFGNLVVVVDVSPMGSIHPLSARHRFASMPSAKRVGLCGYRRSGCWLLFRSLRSKELRPGAAER